MLKAVIVLCAFIWLVLVWGTCAYVVFWLDRSGWWFALAFAASGFSVKINAKS